MGRKMGRKGCGGQFQVSTSEEWVPVGHVEQDTLAEKTDLKTV